MPINLGLLLLFKQPLDEPGRRVENEMIYGLENMLGGTVGMDSRSWRRIKVKDNTRCRTLFWPFVGPQRFGLGNYDSSGHREVHFLRNGRTTPRRF